MKRLKLIVTMLVALALAAPAQELPDTDGDGLPDDLELRLEEGHAASGRVVRADGTGVGNAALQAKIMVEDVEVEVGHFRNADEDGWWTYPDLPAEGALMDVGRINPPLLNVPVVIGEEKIFEVQR